ncbi:hypothetical protein J2129_000899 [Methanofollis sp. W23]|nr:hypothetical protein [Methanofollis sp. W23]
MLPEVLEEPDSVHPGHQVVGDDGVNVFPGDDLARLQRAFAGGDGKLPAPLKEDLAYLEEIRIVVDVEDGEGCRDGFTFYRRRQRSIDLNLASSIIELVIIFDDKNITIIM